MKRQSVSVRDHAEFQASLRQPPEQDRDDDLAEVELAGRRLDRRTGREADRLLRLLDELNQEGGTR